MFFDLSHYDEGAPAYISVRHNCADGKFKYGIGEKVDPAHWANSRTKDKTLNKKLGKIEETVDKLIEAHQKRLQPLYKADISSALDALLGKKRVVMQTWDIIEKIIEDRENGTETYGKKKKRFSPETIKGYRHSRDLLKRYCPAMSFHSMNEQWYDDMVTHYNKQDYAVNSIGKIVKNLRVFAKAAKDRKYHDNEVYKKFDVPTEETKDTFNTLEELTRLHDHNFPNKTLDLVRDWFLIDSFTGLRIGDIKLLNQENLSSDGLLRLANEKTDVTVIIPLHRFVRQILKKHGGFPRKISDQKMNENIKIIGELCKIDSPFLYTVTRGGKRVDHHLKKWEMMSNHTARRSFITNLLIEGVSDSDVMKLAGIKRHATLMKYKKESEEEIARRMKEHKFFK